MVYAHHGPTVRQMDATPPLIPYYQLSTHPLIKVSQCLDPLALIYLIRLVLFPQSKPHGTLLPTVIKGSQSGAGPAQFTQRARQLQAV